MDTNASKTPVPLPFAGWRALSPRQAAREVTQRIAALPPTLRRAAVAWERAEETIEQALSGVPADAPLRGLPYYAKDLFDVAGAPTRAGSSFLADVRPVTANSTLIHRLRELGAALAGKSHLVEFAAGLTGENRTYGDCPHPHFPDRLTGGSSSGSVALVAAGVVPFALGTDTGGSVRVPAAFCGLWGYRGVPGHDYIRDAFPLSPTCDTAGWFTANVADLGELGDALLGFLPTDPRPPRGVFLRANALHPDSPVDAACTAAATRLAEPADAATRDALLASWRDSIDAYATIVMHEAHAVHRAWLEPQRAAYDPAIWQRIDDAGRFSADKVAAARATAERIRADFAAFFQVHDFLVLPCAPLPALTKAQCTPETRKAILAFTTPASLAGLPCLSIPVPLGDGLTAGLQVLVSPERQSVLRQVLRSL